MKITATIITLNEERNIARAIESLRCCEEIIVVDSGSADRTLELAQVRYRVGSGDLRAVLQQSVALFGTRTNLLQVQSERLIQRVNLYLAVGGAFDPITVGSVERGDAHARAEGVQVE